MKPGPFSDPIIGIPVYLLASVFLAYFAYQGGKNQEIKARNLILRPNRNIGLYYTYTVLNLCFVYFCLFNASSLLLKVIGEMANLIILGLVVSAPFVFISFTKWSARKPLIDREIEEVPPCLPAAEDTSHSFTLDQDTKDVLVFKLTSKKWSKESSQIDDLFIVETEQRERLNEFLSTKKQSVLQEMAEIANPASLLVQLTLTRLLVSVKRSLGGKEQRRFSQLAEQFREQLEKFLFKTGDAGELALRRGRLRLWAHQLRIDKDANIELYECVVYLREAGLAQFAATLVAGEEHQAIGKQFGSMSEVETNDSRFNELFVIKTDHRSELLKRLGTTVRNCLCELYEIGIHKHILVQLDGYRLLIVKRLPIGDKKALELLKSKSLHLALALLKPEVESSFLSAADFEIVEMQEDTKAPSSSFCQVCGEAFDDSVVRCTQCQTIHHFDCWHYVGHCSTYGCGSKSYSI